MNCYYENVNEIEHFINIFILQNEDMLQNGAESGPANEEKGSTCFQGPPGPAGPPGPQV